MVYHLTFSPEFIKDEEKYFEHLDTREWFDRPQTNEKGNRNETERLLNKWKIERGYQQKQHGLPENDGQVLQHSDDKERNNARCDDGSPGVSQSDPIPIGSNEEKIVKKRGRPKRI